MKTLLIRMIKYYQKLPIRTHANCKYIPTCSNYAIAVINNFGALKGTLLTIKRIIKCNPFSKGGIDLPPERSH